METKREFEADIDTTQLLALVAELYAAEDEEITADAAANDVSDAVHLDRLHESNNDDIQLTHHGIGAERDRSAMMSKKEHCLVIRCMNHEQRELIL